MKQREIIITMAALLIFLACGGKPENGTVLPDWVHNPLSTEFYLSAVGVGGGKAVALCQALSEISNQIQAQVNSLVIEDAEVEPKELKTQVSRSISANVFGKVTVQSLMQFYEDHDNNGEYSKVVTKVVYHDTPNQAESKDCAIFRTL